MKFEQKFDNLGHSIVDVTFSNEETTKIIDASFEEIAKGLTIPGFRKGKAPLDIAKRYISVEKLNQTYTNKLTKKALKSINTNEEILNKFYFKLVMNAYAQIDDIKLNEETKETTVVVSFLLLPEVVKYPNIADLNVEYEEAKYEDKMLDDELNRLLEDEAMEVPVEGELLEKDTAELSIEAYIADSKRNDLNLNHISVKIGNSDTLLRDKDKELIGKKIGDKGTITIHTDKNFPSEIADIDIDIRYTINAAYRTQLATLDDEFAKSVTKYGEVNSLEDLKKAIKAKLEENLIQRNKFGKINAALEKLIAESEIVVDKERLKREIVKNQEMMDSQQLAASGIDLDTYLKLQNLTREEYEERVFNYNYNPILADTIRAKIVLDNQDKFPKATEEEVYKFNKIENPAEYKENSIKYFVEVGHSEKDAEIRFAQHYGQLSQRYVNNLVDEYIFSNLK